MSNTSIKEDHLKSKYKRFYTFQDMKEIKFKKEEIRPEVILELLNRAELTPNNVSNEQWRCIIYLEEGRKKLANIVKDNPITAAKNTAPSPEKIFNKYLSIPAHIVIIMDDELIQKNVEAASILIQNIQLLAWEKNIAALWRANPYIHSTYIRERLDIKETEQIVGFVQMGYPEMMPEIKLQKTIEHKIQFVTSERSKED